MRVVQLVAGFVLVGHWGGLTWYWNFILPLEDQTMRELEARAIAMGNVTLREAAFLFPGEPHDASDTRVGEWWWIIGQLEPEL